MGDDGGGRALTVEALDLLDPTGATPWHDRLHRARELAGLTQVELAALVGVGPGQVSRWERGAAVPRPPQRRRVAQAIRGAVG